MAIVYNLTLRTNRLQEVINAIDSGPGPGTLRIGTAGMALTLATITLSFPCAVAAAGVLTFSGTPLVDPFAANTGNAVAAEIFNGPGTVVISGLTVGAAGTDIIINLPVITAGSIVTFISGTIIGN